MGLVVHGTWDLPGPGLEPVSPALAGGFLTTAPPGKSPHSGISYNISKWFLDIFNKWENVYSPCIFIIIQVFLIPFYLLY